MLRRRHAHALDRRLARVEALLASVSERLDRTEAQQQTILDYVTVHQVGMEDAIQRLGELRSVGEAVRSATDERVLPVLRALVEQEAEQGRRLAALRATAEYDAPFADAEPLVSVIVPTRAAPPTLFERSLPSILGQSHGRLEVVVVGDAVPPAVGAAVAAIDDDRVRFLNLTHRVVSHHDRGRQHHVSSALARNEGQRAARGAWIVQFDDDDRLAPDAIAVLLARAREARAEVSYAGFHLHAPDAEPELRSAFPPRWGAFCFQAALVHAGLRFFERDLISAQLDLPSDMYLLRRLVRAGVRFAHVDRPLFDYFPALAWQQEAHDPSSELAWPHDEISSAT